MSLYLCISSSVSLCALIAALLILLCLNPDHVSGHRHSRLWAHVIDSLIRNHMAVGGIRLEPLAPPIFFLYLLSLALAFLVLCSSDERAVILTFDIIILPLSARLPICGSGLTSEFDSM